MQRKRRSASDWQKVLVAFSGSDLNPVAFCQANEIGIKSFYRARIKYGSAVGPVARSSPSGFVKVTPSDRPLLPASSVPSAPPGIEVILPHARLRLDASVSPGWVADLLKTLAT